jgi:hypothetical protein
VLSSTIRFSIPEITGGKQKMRDSSGRFIPGQSGNPEGRPKGALSKTTILAKSLVEGQADALIDRAIKNALLGIEALTIFGPVAPSQMPGRCPPGYGSSPCGPGAPGYGPGKRLKRIQIEVLGQNLKSGMV